MCYKISLCVKLYELYGLYRWIYKSHIYINYWQDLTKTKHTGQNTLGYKINKINEELNESATYLTFMKHLRIHLKKYLVSAKLNGIYCYVIYCYVIYCYVFINECIGMRLCECAHVCVSVCVCVYVCVYARVSVYASVCVRARASMCACVSLFLPIVFI